MKKKHRYKQNNMIKDFIHQYISDNIRDILIITVLFFIGLIIGVITVNNLDSEQTEKMQTYINESILNIKQNEEQNYGLMLKYSIRNNFITAGIIWIAVLTIVGTFLIYGVIVTRGFVLGFTISIFIVSLGKWNGIKTSLICLLLQNIIFIPTIFILCIEEKKVIKKIYNNEDKKFKWIFIRYFVTILISSIFLIICSLTEIYLSRRILIIC